MSLIECINSLHQHIEHACASCHRNPDSVQLLAVSKGQTADRIKDTFLAGIHDFGESYVQEAQAKIMALADLPICWHFIGPIQSNKAQTIAQQFTWVHSVSRLKIAQLLHDARPDTLPPLQICIQINFGDDANKSGILPDDALELANHIIALPRLKLRGLMVIPKQETAPQQQYAAYLRLKHLFNALNPILPHAMDTLSMGMSEDYPAAIKAGSTMIRIGRGIFGERIAS